MNIAAYISESESHVYMASDNISIYKEYQLNSNIIIAPEIRPRMLLGIFGYQPAIQALELATIIVPDNSYRRTMIEFVTNNIIPHIDRFQEVENFFFDMLIAFDQRIFHMRKDYSLTEIQGNYNAIGTGKDYTLGALSALDKVSLFTATDKLTIALESANKNSLTSGKITIERI